MLLLLLLPSSTIHLPAPKQVRPGMELENSGQILAGTVKVVPIFDLPSLKLKSEHFSSPPHVRWRLALVIFLGHKTHTFLGRITPLLGNFKCDRCHGNKLL